MAATTIKFVSRLAYLENNYPSSCILAREKPVRPMGGKGEWETSFEFAAFPSHYDAMMFLMAQPRDKHRYHEVLKPGDQKVFLDIDLEAKNAPNGDHMGFGNSLTQLIIQCMAEYCGANKMSFNVETDVALATSHSETKFSMHIVFPRHRVLNIKGEMRHFVERELCGVAKDHETMKYALEKRIIDLGVYNRNHNFRTVFSDKVNAKGRFVIPQDEFTLSDGRVIRHDRGGDEKQRVYLEFFVGSPIKTGDDFYIPVKLPERKAKVSTVDELEAELVLEKLYDAHPFEEGTFEVRSVSGGMIQLNRLLPFGCPACKGEHDGDNPFITVFKYRDSEARWAALRCRAGKSFVFYCLDPEIEAQPKPLPQIALDMVARYRRENGLDDNQEAEDVPEIPEPKPTHRVLRKADLPAIPDIPRNPNLVKEMTALRENGGRFVPENDKPKPIVEFVEEHTEPASAAPVESDDDEPEVEFVEKPKTKKYFDHDKPKRERSGYNIYDTDYYWADFAEEFQHLTLISYCEHIIDDYDDPRFHEAVDAIHEVTNRPIKTITCDTPTSLIEAASRVVAVVNDSISAAKIFCKNREDVFERSSRARLSANAGGSCMLIKVDKKGKVKYERFKFSAFLSRFEYRLSYKRAVTIPFPNDPDSLLPEPNSVKRGEFNIFPGFRARIVKLDAEKLARIQPFLAHLEKYTANGDRDIYRWIIWWFRRIIVEYKKPDMMLMFAGEQGAGKGIVFQMFGDILGDDLFLSIGTLDAFFKDFNKMQSQKLLIYIQEFGKAKGNQQILYDKFKARIDQKKCTVEAKFNDAFQEVNRSGIGSSSNHPEMIRAVDGDRRSIFLKCSDAVTCDAEYWEKFYQMFPEADEDPEGNLEIANILYSYLHSEECKNFVEVDPVTGKKHNYFRPPKTELREEIIAQSRNLGQEYISELMTKAKRVDPGTIIAINKGTEHLLLSDNIWDSFVHWMRDRHISPEYQMKRVSFMNEVRKWTGTKSIQTKIPGGSRPCGYRITEELYEVLVASWERPDSDSEDDADETG